MQEQSKNTAQDMDFILRWVNEWEDRITEDSSLNKYNEEEIDVSSA